MEANANGLKIELVEYRPDWIDRLRAPWDALHRNHMKVAPQIAGVPVRGPEDAWRARLNKYMVWIQEPGAFAVGAHFQGELVGYVFGRLDNGWAGWAMSAKVGRIETLAVVEHMRDHGIGSILLNEAKRRIKASGSSVVMLSVIAYNTEAIEFYEREGFITGSVELVQHV